MGTSTGPSLGLDGDERLRRPPRRGTGPYADDGRLRMAQSLAEQHPDVARVGWRGGRYQHVVDSKPFRTNKLVRKPGLEIPEGPDNFGMVLQHLVDGRWIVPGRDLAPPPDQIALPIDEKQLSLFDEIAA